MDGLDEISTLGPTRVSELRDGEIHSHTIDPRDFGIAYARLSDLQADTADESARAIRAILAGEKGPRYDIAVLNAAAALVVAERAADLAAGLQRAREAIDSGKARQTLEMLVRHSNG
jgi:anthranilate phosphoribosyltransferase